jgi:hypothetical protein
VPEIIDPVFAKTSQNARFLLSENERFGLVFVKTGSINSGTGLFLQLRFSRHIQYSFEKILSFSLYGPVVEMVEYTPASFILNFIFITIAFSIKEPKKTVARSAQSRSAANKLSTVCLVKFEGWWKGDPGFFLPL